MREDKLTPEEKLLRLIRKDKKAIDAAGKNISRNSSERKTIISFSLISLVRKLPSLLTPKKITLAAFLAACLYLAANLIYPFLGFKGNNLPQISEKENIALMPEPIEEPKPFEFYLGGIKDRNIFANIGGQLSSKPQGDVNIDLTKDISLVGIISGDDPQAVIEDKKSQKTYYLNKGQFIGEMQIEDIQEGKIIIKYRGENFELHL